ncbi:MAG: GNAT family N-acetyltransferase [Planctomycetaceae bacterium]|nr:GNAT family N-acetyltransferase [Planctomycetaceae bacterium]
MRVQLLTELDELEPHAEAWDRLAADVPFRGWTWLSQWWRHYGPRTAAESSRCRLAVLGVFDDADVLVGVAPWYLEHSTFGGRVLHAMGSGEVCSDYLGVLCAPTVEGPVVETLADYLISNARRSGPDRLAWDLIDLEGVDAEDRVMTRLADAMAASGATVYRRPGMNCWRLELPTDWDAYLASVGKNMRRFVHRWQRTLAAVHQPTLRWATTAEELPGAMDILVDLHQRRWRTLGQPGCFASERFAAFHRDVATALFARGQVQFYWLLLDGVPAAAEYHLIGDGVSYEYQAGIDPAAMTHEPGKLINLMLVRHAIEQGFRVFDFLRGDEEFKVRFGSRQRAMVKYRIVPPTTVARTRHRLWLLGNRMKHWLKKKR